MLVPALSPGSNVVVDDVEDVSAGRESFARRRWVKPEPLEEESDPSADVKPEPLEEESDPSADVKPEPLEGEPDVSADEEPELACEEPELPDVPALLEKLPEEPVPPAEPALLPVVGVVRAGWI